MNKIFKVLALLLSMYEPGNFSAEKLLELVSRDLSAQKNLNQGSYNLPSSKIKYAINVSGIDSAEIENCVRNLTKMVKHHLSSRHAGISITDVVQTCEDSTQIPYIVITLKVSKTDGHPEQPLR